AAVRRSRRSRSSVSPSGGATAPGGASRLSPGRGSCGTRRGAALGLLVLRGAVVLVGRAVGPVARAAVGGARPARGARPLAGIDGLVGLVGCRRLPAALPQHLRGVRRDPGLAATQVDQEARRQEDRGVGAG